MWLQYSQKFDEKLLKYTLIYLNLPQFILINLNFHQALTGSGFSVSGRVG